MFSSACAYHLAIIPDIVTHYIFLFSTGVRDENVRAYTPKVVRIGLKPHHSVEAVSLDYLVCIQFNLWNFIYYCYDENTPKIVHLGLKPHNTLEAVSRDSLYVFSNLRT